MKIRLRSFGRPIGAATLATLVAGAALVSAAPSSAAVGTTVALTSSANPSAYGQAVTLKAVVADPGVPTAAITGTMTFTDGAVALASLPVTRGVARYATRLLSAGSHDITASYVPPGAIDAAASALLTQTVTIASTTTTITTTRNPTYSVQAGAITARVRGVAPAVGIPTGSVDFYVDGSWYWTAPVDAMGRAQLTYADLGTGTWNVTATYAGDLNFDASSSGPIAQQILPTAPDTTVTYTPATVSTGGTSQLVIAAHNGTGINMPSVAIGLRMPPGGVVVSMPGACRMAWPNLFYCLTSLSPGKTAKIVIRVTAPAAPLVITTSGYSRNIDTMDETGATATLTVV